MRTSERLKIGTGGGRTGQRLAPPPVETPPQKSLGIGGTKINPSPIAKFLGNVTGATGIIKGLKGTLEGKPLGQNIKTALGGAGKLGLTLGTLGTSGVASSLGLRGGQLLAAKSAEMGLTGAAFQALDNVEKGAPTNQGVLKAGAIGAAIPVVGAALGKSKNLVSDIGKRIQSTVIKPSATDIKNGFKIETLGKYKIGGSLGQMAHQTQDNLDSLSKQLYEKVGRKDVPLDLNKVYENTKKLLEGDKAKSFGNLGSTRRVLDSLAAEIDEVSPGRISNLAQSQAIKQAAGLKGSWVFGSADPDASAIERVYNTFYGEIKKEIERVAPSGVREINKQISELIPVMNAIVRRIPIAERNNVLSLTDVLSMGFTAVHPSAAALMAVNKLSKSGRVGATLSKLGSKVPKTNLGKRIFLK